MSIENLQSGLSHNPDAIDGSVPIGEISEDFVDLDDGDQDNDQDNDQNEGPMQTKLTGSKIPGLLKKCAKAINEIKLYEAERSETNAEIKAIREGLEVAGIPKKSLAFALAVSKMDDDQMDGFYLALHFLLKSIDRAPSQADLFLGPR